MKKEPSYIGGANFKAVEPSKKPRCENCNHEQCGFCKSCHNMECGHFGEPLKPCYDQFLNKKSPDEGTWEVCLVDEKTLLGQFQKERTKAISEMFENKYENGIYPTSKFFYRLDKCVSELLTKAKEEGRRMKGSSWREGYETGMREERERVDKIIEKEIGEVSLHPIFPGGATDLARRVGLKTLSRISALLQDKK